MEKKIPEIEAKNILIEYNGANNQLIEWKTRFIREKNFKLTRTQADYVLKHHQTTPKVAKKYINIVLSFGEKLQEEKRLVKPVEKVWCEKLLCETDKAYHIWGRFFDSEPLKAFWLPKSAVLQPEKKLNRVIDYSKYSHRPPKPWQPLAIEKLLANDRFILADDMGLAKTSSSIMAALESEVKKILIVCPANVKINWKKEIRFYTDRPVLIVEGRKWGSIYDFYIINYDILKNYHTTDKKDENDDLKLILNENFELAIIDEAHYLSNSSSQRTKLMNDILKEIPKVWLLTGTPMTNRPINYYNLLKIVDSPVALNWQHYVKRYCKGFRFKVNGRTIWNTGGHSNLDELRERTKNVVLRRLKTEIPGLPEKTISPIFLELQSTFYNEELEEFMRISEEQKGHESIAVTINRLMKVRQVIAYEKIPYTCELIDKCLELDKKVIVFSNFTMPLDMLHEKYPKNSVIYDGRISATKREEVKDKFQNDPKIKILFGNIIAAGIGINLTAAEVVIMNDLSFVPSHHSQAEDRCVYEGQLVLTDSGYKKIENVQIGNMVYTHKGKFQKVYDKHTHLERKKKRIDINALGTTESLSLTEDHLVYVYNKEKKLFEWVEAGKLDIFNHQLTLKVNSCPKERKEFLDVKNYVNYIFKNQFEIDQTNGRLVKLPENVELTNDLLYAFGFFIAEGWAYDNDSSNVKKSSYISVVQKIDNKKMYDAAQYIINIFKKSFNITSHNEYIDKSECKTCTIYSKNLSKNFIEWFGKGAINKKLPIWVDELNNEQLSILLDGYNHGDGYHRRNTQNVSTISSLLASQLVVYNAKLGRTVSFKSINPKTKNHNRVYIIEYSTNLSSPLNKIHKIDDYITYPISSLTIKRPSHKEERVYDLSVESDNSFVVNVYNVHNCYRQGQNKDVLVYYPIFENTIEQIVYNILQRKKDVIDQVMGDGEYSEGFSKELLKELL